LIFSQAASARKTALLASSAVANKPASCVLGLAILRIIRAVRTNEGPRLLQAPQKVRVRLGLG
jgi:hypothetical protein